ncbi:terpene synthase family protein [Streptomyces sp. HSW2009]|uniref:terpene synthase family protein n=1 Tax=Streptomyces sp. HSW2009 TaxID=3142890 RepID=UPI0032ED71EF
MQRIELSYPTDWWPPATALPTPGQCATLHDHLVSWLKEHGLARAPGTLTTVRSTGAARAIAYSMPHALPARLPAVVHFLGCWFLYDDAAEGAGIDGRETAAGRALAGTLAVEHCRDDQLRAWWDLGQEFSRTMSPRWRDRFGKHFEAWMYGVGDEALLSRSGCGQPPLAGYLAVRTQTIGVDVLADLVEYAMDRELSPDFLTDPYVQELQQLARTLATIDNDLHSISKDRSNDWLNGVFSLADERDVPELAACRELARLHAAQVARYELVESRLRSHVTPADAWWLVAMRHLVTGLLRWTRSVPRYAHEHALPGGVTLHIDAEQPVG